MSHLSNRRQHRNEAGIMQKIDHIHVPSSFMYLFPDVGNLSQSNQPPRSTQPGHPFVVSAMSTGQRVVMLCNWGVKADMVLFAGNTV